MTRKGSDWQMGASFDRDLEGEPQEQPVIIIRDECHNDGMVCRCAGECDHSCSRQLEEHPLIKQFFADIEEEYLLPKPPIEPENLKTGILIFAGERENVREIVTRFKSHLVYGWNVLVFDGGEL